MCDVSAKYIGYVLCFRLNGCIVDKLCAHPGRNIYFQTKSIRKNGIKQGHFEDFIVNYYISWCDVDLGLCFLCMKLKSFKKMNLAGELCSYPFWGLPFSD